MGSGNFLKGLADMIFMNTAEAISLIYKGMSKFEGPAAAREHVSIVIGNSIDDLMIDNIPVTPENIEKRLCEKAEVYRDMVDEKSA